MTSNPCCFTAPCDVWRHGSTLIHELTHAVDMVRSTLTKGEDPFRFPNQSRAAELRTLAAVHGTAMARAPATAGRAGPSRAEPSPPLSHRRAGRRRLPAKPVPFVPFR